MDASAPCVKKARVAPSSVHIWTARPSAAVKTETDTLSDDDAPLTHMMNGVNCLPKPSAAPSAHPCSRRVEEAPGMPPGKPPGMPRMASVARLRRV